jgi:hypothetical protein
MSIARIGLPHQIPIFVVSYHAGLEYGNRSQDRLLERGFRALGYEHVAY